MSYASTTIGAILDEVNIRYFLPAIQRPYVWTPDQIVTLFDSLLKGYPISSFLLWEVDEATKHNLPIYRFLEDYREGARNEITSPAGRKIVLVLDGQQRLTSLMIGLRGTYAIRDKNARKSNPDSWHAKSLYIDLLKDPEYQAEEDDDLDLGVSYGIAFHKVQPRKDPRRLWMKLSTILDHPGEEGLARLLDLTLGQLYRGATPYEIDTVTKTLTRLHEVIWSEEIINFYTERGQSLERVLNIFIRANNAGSKLSKPDLLMSMITTEWPTGAAREEVESFVDRIERRLVAKNEFSRDTALKACLVCCDLDVKYNVSSFTSEAIETIARNWEGVKSAIERAYRLINHFGINQSNLSSQNAVLPLAYFFFLSPGVTLLGSTEFDRVNARRAQRWLIQSLLIGAFGGSSDSTLSVARATIRKSLATDRSFPEEALYRALEDGRRRSRLDEQGLEEILDLKYGNKKTLLALSLLYDNVDWLGESFHVDHIIPQANAQKRVLQGRNIGEHRIAEITHCVDRLGNLQLLSGSENREKSDLPFDSWITGRDRFFLERHHIPPHSDLWTVTSLPEFVRAREALIRKALLDLLGGRMNS